MAECASIVWQTDQKFKLLFADNLLHFHRSSAPVPIHSHCIRTVLLNKHCLKDVRLNIFFCVPMKKASHMSMEGHDAE